MMKNFFECKIRYEKTLENGMQKKVTETFLVDSLSFTEAEKRIIEEVQPFISGEFTVSDIKRANYSELFFSNEGTADRYFKCKVLFITLDEKSGSEKKTASYMLVQASCLQEALYRLTEGMKGTMSDYEIASISETPIMDVYPYKEKEDGRVEIEFEGYKTTIDKSELLENIFTVRFNGSLTVQFKSTPIGIVAENAMDGHGFSAKDKYAGKLLKYHRE